MTDIEDGSPETARQHRLAAYLSRLHPTTQIAVMREVEMSELRGESLGDSFKTVMKELRKGIRKSGLPVRQAVNPSVIFYVPVEPFVVDQISEEPVVATVPRLSLNAIWAWICRNLLPREAQTYIDLAKAALEADDQPSALTAATLFQDEVVEAARPAMRSKTATLERRLAAYGGPQTVLADLHTVVQILRMRDALKEFTTALPASIDLSDKAALTRVAKLVTPKDASDEARCTQGLAIIMARLADPWQLVRLASSGGKTRETIAELVLGRARLMANELRMEQWSLDQADHVRARTTAMRAAIDLLRSELKPQSGSVEERRCSQIASVIERCERKIELTMGGMGTHARSAAG